jgi:YD repeat-containing protein
MQRPFINILSVLLIISSSAYSQTENYFDKARKVPILTPEAASFAKYVEFPVTLYNGVPNISIPIYTIQSGDISVPITLSYHAGGIKVSEESSIVGLGWNLNDGGGMISRQVNGRDDWDNGASDYFGVIFPADTSYSEYNTANTVYGLCLTSDKFRQSVASSYASQLVDIVTNGEGEPDTYIYNFGQFSGKFINTDRVHDFERNNIRFTVQVGSIIAKTPDGYLYEFNDLEKGRVGAYPYAIIGYRLSRITSPKGKVVNFTYETLYDQRMIDTYSEEFSTSYPLDGGANANPGTLSQKLQANEANLIYLTRIDFDEGYVDFIRDTRTDMSGKRLTRIDIKYKDGSLLKSFSFNQTYFVGASTHYYPEPKTVYADPYGAPYPDDFIKTRLRLDALVETGNDSSIPPKQYSFEYYDGGTYTLPFKTSWAVDYWGYYNGATSNTTFIPKSKGFQLASPYAVLNDYQGANREPSEEPMKAGTLKKITYPTKGWTEYSYSAHQFTNVTGAPVKYQITNAAVATDIGTGRQESTFTLTEAKSVLIDVSLYCNCISNYCMYSGSPTVPWDCGGLMGMGYDDNHVLYAELRKFNPSTGTFDFIDWDHTWDGNDILPVNGSGDFHVAETLSAGTYKVVANYPDLKGGGTLGSKMAFISVRLETAYHDPSIMAGGLRISQIKHHDVEQNVDLTSNYEYYDGTLMSFPTFYWRKLQYIFEEANQQTGGFTHIYSNEYLYGNSIIPFSASAHSGNVGYSRVVEKRENGVGGWTEYVYENYEDSQYMGGVAYSNIAVSPYAPGEPSATHVRNGFLKESTLFDNTGNPVKKTVNTPSILLGETFWSFKKEVFNTFTDYSYPINQPCTNLQVNSCMLYFYPIQMGKVVPAQTTEYNYSNGNQQASTTTFSYNAVGDPSSQETVGSDGRISRTEYKYLSDYVKTSGWLNDLNILNKRNEPLETFSKINGNVVNGTFLKYQTINGKTLPNEVYGIETNSLSSIASTAPNAIIPTELKLKGTIVNDANGNISYSVAKDNSVTSYIWGYNNTFPIAVIQNALPSQVYYTSFEELTSNFSTISMTGGKSYNGTSAYTVPLPSAGTYQLTYWIKNGSGNWQYMISTINSATSIGGGTNVLIDEVRVYPVNAQMTTYTYDVLLGMTSKTDPNGIKTSYHFDGFGRLKTITDKDDNILKVFEYSYKN